MADALHRLELAAFAGEGDT